MKKTAIGLILLIICVSSCKNKGKKVEMDSTKTSKKISKRAYFINKSNSYNDLFLDSMVVRAYTVDKNIPDSIATRMVSFYNSRNYQFAWFSSTGVSEQTRGFWNMYKYYSIHDPSKIIKNAFLLKKMDELVATDDSNWVQKPPALVPVELELTAQYLHFFLANIGKGYLKRKEIERFIPSMKSDPIKMADSIVSKKHKDDKYYADVNPAYADLLKYIAKYMAVYKNGGWPVLAVKASELKPGTTGQPVLLLKKRLALSEDLNVSDTSSSWTPALTNAIKRFQSLHGYKESGVITDNQLKDLNVPVTDRIIQMLVNLGRTQWIIDQPKGKFILVNIPEFLLHVTENGSKIFDMIVVVGKEGHNTTIFTGTLNQVVFAPYWNVPESIVINEILPGMKKNANYLKDHQMEITGNLGNGIPAIRQLPGEKNSLGKVKFLFPNSYDIYFHDTPSKSLFAKEKRAFSHGCIRLSEPQKMAEWILQYDPNWDNENIATALNATEEKSVRVKEPVPVMITYYTAWVAEDGLLHFTDDIYGHDRMQVKRMFK